MPKAEMALLQFVALTLPAVAILLQAVLSYQDKYHSDGDVLGFKTEFQFIEWGFALLVFSGLLFSAKIVIGSNSWIIQGGVILLSLSLIILGIAILVAFRRPLYLEDDVTVESALKQKTWKYGKYVIVTAMIGGIGYLVPPNIDGLGITGLKISNFITFATLLSSSLISVIGSMVVFVHYLNIRRGKERQKQWRKQTLELANDINDLVDINSLNPDDDEDIRNFHDEIDRIRSRLDNLINSYPDEIEFMEREHLRRIDSLLAYLEEESHKYIDIITKMDALTNKFERTTECIDNLTTEGELQNTSANSNTDAIDSDTIEQQLAELRNRKQRVKRQIKDLEDKKDIYKSDLRYVTDEVSAIIIELQEISEVEN
ncbi:hypothetical protein [Haladaptatus salinisoli]|uniref:hypothetical protein n=1 Tax=Haladaptatus salinisoli TaxID=2884876 RepID=UPI001D09C089|nr:hypothetical protein [Haladaptatus salinisoli]